MTPAVSVRHRNRRSQMPVRRPVFLCGWSACTHHANNDRNKQHFKTDPKKYPVGFQADNLESEPSEPQAVHTIRWNQSVGIERPRIYPRRSMSVWNLQSDSLTRSGSVHSPTLTPDHQPPLAVSGESALPVPWVPALNPSGRV